ncbi:hypothetical protein C1645_807163 [Glomus cerebriforme]|uniref:Uncharacterized protein n=1 Tax=Glomus cerebriforme TaxID=658196 RepID=A0A397SUH7_9GLOM|nr:hypothetical protein C1645_807163 [Glomus cerebriforme]
MEKYLKQEDDETLEGEEKVSKKDSFSSSNAPITRELIENTIHQPLHSLLIPAHKCKSPYAFHHHLSARTIFKRDYLNIIHKEILSPKPKVSTSPTSSSFINICTSSSRPSSKYSYTSSPSASTKILDQEINILASLWGDSPQDVKQIYELLEKCSEKIHEYMFKANRIEKEREQIARKRNSFETIPFQLSNIFNQQQNIITTDSKSVDENYDSKVQGQ